MFNSQIEWMENDVTIYSFSIEAISVVNSETNKERRIGRLNFRNWDYPNGPFDPLDWIAFIRRNFQLKYSDQLNPYVISDLNQSPVPMASMLKILDN